MPWRGIEMSGLEFLGRSIVEALGQLVTGRDQVYGAMLVSLYVAGAATAICTLAGVPAGFLLATRDFRGRRLAVTLLNTLMALPTVVVGLFVYSFITRRSLLGPLDLMFSTDAMIVGEVILGLPIVTALTLSAVASQERAVRETAATLGAGPLRSAATVLWEGRFALGAAIAAAFGRLVGEVGVAMILGGNIAGSTRTMATAMALETSKGEFPVAMALGIVLMSVALGVNFVLRYLQGKGEAR